MLTILFMYILAVAMYTVAVRLNGTNRYVPNFEWKATIIDGMKGIGIGFLILAALYFGFILINNLIAEIKY